MTSSQDHKTTFRVLSVLELLASSAAGLTLSEISAALDAPKSSLFPIIHTMAAHDFLYFNPETSRYAIGLKSYTTGSSYLKENEVMKLFHQKMQEVVDRCLETCQLGILDAGHVLYIGKADSPEPIRLESKIGKLLPAYCTALGKALLCDFTREKLCRFYSGPLQPYTANTILNPDDLYTQLEEIRRTALSYDHGEVFDGIDCIATPIRQNGPVICAMSVTTPSYRFTPEKKALIAQSLLDAKRELEEILSLQKVHLR